MSDSNLHVALTRGTGRPSGVKNSPRVGEILDYRSARFLGPQRATPSAPQTDALSSAVGTRNFSGI